MKVVTVVGARPQFIKAAPVGKVLRQTGHHEILVHTGQHYDNRMSQVFFEELGIPEPDTNLEVGSGPAGWQTGQMLIGLEDVLLTHKPDWVLVYGDTTSTLAGALAALKTCIPLAHIEAGLRSFNRQMPEEHNRVLTDHCADMLFCPTRAAVDNLEREGITAGVKLVGDTMYDAVLQFAPLAHEHSAILQALDLRPKSYILATVHRSYNADNPDNLRNILSALLKIDSTVIFPVHPRTRQKIAELNGTIELSDHESNLIMIEPVSYFDMLVLEENARAILTDSGGIQKEAYFLGVPCLTLRSETEWLETVHSNWNQLVGTSPDRIIQAAEHITSPSTKPPQIFGHGDAALRIVSSLDAGTPI